MRCARQAEDKRGARARTSDDDNQGDDMPSWIFKDESNKEETKNRDSKKKPAQLKKTDNHATQDAKVPRRHLGRKVCYRTSFDEGSDEEER